MIISGGQGRRVAGHAVHRHEALWATLGRPGAGRTNPSQIRQLPESPRVLLLWGMTLARTFMTIVVVAVMILGPALFMASSPCFDCDGVCGAAATVAAVLVTAVLHVQPMMAEPRAHLFSLPLRLSELPPRPRFTTV